MIRLPIITFIMMLFALSAAKASPVAVIGIDVLPPYEVGQIVNLDASGSFDTNPLATITDIIWQTGDGTFSFDEIFQHTYLTPGIFLLSLTIGVDIGPDFSDRTTLVVTVTEPAVVPLPAAFPLFGTGLGILGFLGWRRRRQAQAV